MWCGVVCVTLTYYEQDIEASDNVHPCTPGADCVYQSWTSWSDKQKWEKILKEEWMRHVGHAILCENTIHGDIDALVSVISVPLP